MKNPTLFRFAPCTLVMASMLPAIAFAHPGHDGHELTWDLGHLAANPVATLLWVVLLGTGIWAALKHARSSAAQRSLTPKERDRQP